MFLLDVILLPSCSFFFFNDTATTEIYTLSLHDALPICPGRAAQQSGATSDVRRSRYCRGRRRSGRASSQPGIFLRAAPPDRKSTRLNSSHANISYAVFCLKKKKTNQYHLNNIL